MTGKSNNLEHSQLIDLLNQLKNSDDQIKIFYKSKIFHNKYLINNKIIDNHNLRNIIDSAVILSKQSDFIIQYIKEKNIEKTNDLVEFINEIIKLAYNFSEINEIQYKLIIEKIDNLYLTNGEIINEAKSNIIKNFSIHLNNMDKNIKETKEKQQLMDKLLETAKLTTGSSSIIKSNNYFEDSSKTYGYLTLFWTIVLAILFVLFSYMLIFLYKNPGETPIEWFSFVTYISIRITGIVFLFYNINFSVKMLMANQHNYVINKHKQNALQTFLALVNSTTHEDKKDIILTYAADCIYSHQETGFNNKSKSKDSTPAEQIAKVVESIRKLAPKESK